MCVPQHRGCPFHSCLLSKVLHRVEILHSLTYWSDRRKQQRTESQTQEKPLTLQKRTPQAGCHSACTQCHGLSKTCVCERQSAPEASANSKAVHHKSTKPHHLPSWSVTTGTGPHPTRPVQNQPRGCVGSHFPARSHPLSRAPPHAPDTIRGQLPKRTIGSCALCSGFSLNKRLKTHSPPATLKVLPQDHHAEEGVGFEVHTHDPRAFPRYQSSTGLASHPQATFAPHCFVPHLLPICPAVRELLFYWWESRSTESPDRSSLCCHFLFRFSLHNRRGRHWDSQSGCEDKPDPARTSATLAGERMQGLGGLARLGKLRLGGGRSILF